MLFFLDFLSPSKGLGRKRPKIVFFVFFVFFCILRTVGTNGRDINIRLEFKRTAASVDLIRSKQLINIRFSDVRIDVSARGLVDGMRKYFAVHLFNNDVNKAMGTFDDFFHF